MAEHGSWASIREHGLLSTSAILDLYGISGPRRMAIESMRRPTCVPIKAKGLPRAVVRDQIPMSDSKLRSCLLPPMTIKGWYELLNAKVFFWFTRDRVHKLSTAQPYQDRAHDVIEVNTRSLIQAHRDRIWLCPINSGSTLFNPSPRGESTFSRIRDYPYRHRRTNRRRSPVELAVDYSVPDIARHVVRVVVIRCAIIENELYAAH